MNKKIISTILAGGVAGALSVSAQVPAERVNPSAPYSKTNVQAQLRLNVDKDTETVHFIRDSIDNNVVTKPYILKHADPFEVRSYIQNLVQSRQVSQNNTDADIIKYNDGYSVLLVSAEENRFGPQPNGQGLDEIIAALDKPKFIASSGSSRYFYFPQYRNANELKALLNNVGANRAGDTTELQYGKDVIVTDSGLNALMIFTPQYSKKNVSEMLKFYDNPVVQATVKYTVYEIDAENDGKIGNDYQSWKNGDGLDLLSVGGRYTDNWANTAGGGVNTTSGWNKTQFFNFNPKWSSRYFDFLVSSGHAQVVTSGEIVVRNNKTAVINKSTGLFYDQYTPIAAKTFDQTLAVTSSSGKTIRSGWVDPAAAGTAEYYFSAADSGGNAVTVSGTSFAGSLAVAKIQPNGSGNPWYSFSIEGGTLIKNGNDIGTQADITSFKLFKRNPIKSTNDGSITAYTWNEVTSYANDIVIEKGNAVNTVASNAFGFNLELTPKIFQKAAILEVKANNSSLLGWKSDGTPRVSKNNEVDAEVMLSTNGTRFVIGGLEKRQVVRSVSGVPYLREIPGLGWLFSTESESTKRSSLVIVADVRLSEFDEPLKETIAESARQLDAELKNSGKSIKWGYGQKGIDSESESNSKAPVGQKKITPPTVAAKSTATASK